MTNYDVVKKLIGPIDPLGITHEDKKRYENLQNMTALVDKLISDIAVVAENKGRVERSMNLAGKHAHMFFEANGISEY